MQGQRKKRDKSCVMDSRYTDPSLVDPELPSSWKARQIAFQLSNSDEMDYLSHGNRGPREAQVYISDGPQDRYKPASL